jgi:hypothetical protein
MSLEDSAQESVHQLRMEVTSLVAATVEARIAQIKNGNEMWRWIAIFLLGTQVTMITFYVTQFRRSVNQDEVIFLIKTNAPYLQDKEWIYGELEHLRDDQARMQREIDASLGREGRLDSKRR